MKAKVPLASALFTKQVERTDELEEKERTNILYISPFSECSSGIAWDPVNKHYFLRVRRTLEAHLGRNKECVQELCNLFLSVSGQGGMFERSFFMLYVIDISGLSLPIRMASH